MKLIWGQSRRSCKQPCRSCRRSPRGSAVIVGLVTLPKATFDKLRGGCLAATPPLEDDCLGCILLRVGRVLMSPV